MDELKLEDNNVIKMSSCERAIFLAVFSFFFSFLALTVFRASLGGHFCVLCLSGGGGVCV